jgi:hypothetical protein
MKIHTSVKLLTLALNDAYKGKIKFVQTNVSCTQSFFWKVVLSEDGFRVIAQNNGVNTKDYVLVENAKDLEEILLAIEKDQ